MHIVTFYSFKGGVGRTMALANVAFLLAKAGRRVLTVDFDLEAPGMTSYQAFRDAHDRAGLVEFVSEYLSTESAPAVDDYITACDFGGIRMWTMPAGRHSSPDYSRMLAAIDWNALYKRHQGFLLMEDLKEQWAQHDGKGFDYVLIDSRTGHTDVGGICTRQLPDSVVVMFVPTPQNVDGLVPVVSAIAREGAPVRERPVKMIFCPSNVPDLDDDEEILAELLENARQQLRYDRPAATIQQYASLELLRQPIIAYSVPGSRLARQYDELKRSILIENLRDREGALLALRSAREDFDRARKENDRGASDRITTVAAQVRAQWSDDGEIAWELANFANTRVRPDEEIEALTTVLRHGIQTARALLHRATARAALGQPVDAMEDIRLLIAKEPATIFEVIPAIQIARKLSPQSLTGLLQEGLLNERMDMAGKSLLLMSLMTSHDGLIEARNTAELLMAAAASPGDVDRLRTSYVLTLIGLGDYRRAMDVLSGNRRHMLEKGGLSDVFNFAMAEWAVSGELGLDLATRVLQLRDEIRAPWDPNSLQCFAVCNSALGNATAAADELAEARSKISSVDFAFSCWRYMLVSASELVADLDEMSSWLDSGRSLRPPALSLPPPQ